MRTYTRGRRIAGAGSRLFYAFAVLFVLTRDYTGSSYLSTSHLLLWLCGKEIVAVFVELAATGRKLTSRRFASLRSPTLFGAKGSDIV